MCCVVRDTRGTICCSNPGSGRTVDVEDGGFFFCFRRGRQAGRVYEYEPHRTRSRIRIRASNSNMMRTGMFFSARIGPAGVCPAEALEVSMPCGPMDVVRFPSSSGVVQGADPDIRFLGANTTLLRHSSFSPRHLDSVIEQGKRAHASAGRSTRFEPFVPRTVDHMFIASAQTCRNPDQ